MREDKSHGHKSVKPAVKLAILLSNERSCVVCCGHFEEENCTGQLPLVTNFTFFASHSDLLLLGLPKHFFSFTFPLSGWNCQNTTIFAVAS